MQHLESPDQSCGRHLRDTTASTLTGTERLRDVASFRRRPGTAASQLDNHEQRPMHGSERLFPKQIVNHPISDVLPQDTSHPPGPPRPAHRSAQPQPRTPRRRLTGLAHAHAHASPPPRARPLSPRSSPASASPRWGGQRAPPPRPARPEAEELGRARRKGGERDLGYLYCNQ